MNRMAVVQVVVQAQGQGAQASLEIRDPLTQYVSVWVWCHDPMYSCDFQGEDTETATQAPAEITECCCHGGTSRAVLPCMISRLTNKFVRLDNTVTCNKHLRHCPEIDRPTLSGVILISCRYLDSSGEVRHWAYSIAIMPFDNPGMPAAPNSTTSRLFVQSDKIKNENQPD
jgi:hypothetical protein